MAPASQVKRMVYTAEENSEEVFKNPLFMEMISFSLRSTSASWEGVSLNMKIDIPASQEGIECRGGSESSGQPNSVAVSDWR